MLLWARNSCAALSTSRPDGIYGYDADPDRTRAQAKALARCRGAKGKSCVVQASPCASDDPGLPLSAYSQTTKANPYVGTWNLNVAKSDFGKTPALYIPKSETLVIIAGNSDDDRKFTLWGISDDGKTLTNTAVHKTPDGDVNTTMVYDKVK